MSGEIDADSDSDFNSAIDESMQQFYRQDEHGNHVLDQDRVVHALASYVRSKKRQRIRDERFEAMEDRIRDQDRELYGDPRTHRKGIIERVDTMWKWSMMANGIVVAIVIFAQVKDAIG